MLAWRYRNDLNRLALLYGTDKWGRHWYTQHYQRYFRPFRRMRLNLLEIGVGGKNRLSRGGASLRMWKAYFPKGRIVGIDIADLSHLREPRIDIRQCDQTDAEALRRLTEEYGGFDIVIDDGSHRNEDVIKAFHTLFPLVRIGGLYAVEDVQTAYWPTWGGGLGNSHTSVAFFKSLVDGLNHVEYAIEDYQASYFDKHIVEMAFFHNLVIIRKGVYEEQSTPPQLIKDELRWVRKAAALGAAPAAESLTGGVEPPAAARDLAGVPNPGP